MEESVSIHQNCSHCGSKLINKAPVCYQCGLPRVPVEEWDGAYHRYRVVVYCFYSINFLLVLLFNFWPPASKSILGLIVVDGLILIATLYFAWYIKEDIAYLFKWKKFRIWKGLVLVFIAIISAIVVHYGVKWVNLQVFHYNLYYYSSFSELPFPRLMMLLLIALIPAFSEELAYRGIIHESLLKIMHYRSGVVLTAIMFAVIHMSLISFFWLLPFALFLGWLRQREKTIWAGMLVHFSFNATVCFLEFLELGLI